MQRHYILKYGLNGQINFWGVTVLNDMIIQNILTNYRALNLSHIVWGN